MKAIESKSFIYLFILFHFICHTIITKNIGKVEKKKLALPICIGGQGTRKRGRLGPLTKPQRVFKAR